MYLLNCDEGCSNYKAVATKLQMFLETSFCSEDSEICAKFLLVRELYFEQLRSFSVKNWANDFDLCARSFLLFLDDDAGYRCGLRRR